MRRALHKSACTVACQTPTTAATRIAPSIAYALLIRLEIGDFLAQGGRVPARKRLPAVHRLVLGTKRRALVIRLRRLHDAGLIGACLGVSTARFLQGNQ